MNQPFEIKRTKKYGRGLYASRDIKRGEVVEVSPAIVLRNQRNKNKLNLLVFALSKRRSVLALGYGSLFNHSEWANVDYKVSRTRVRFTANQWIKAGEQLFIDYGYDPRLYSNLWRKP